MKLCTMYVQHTFKLEIKTNFSWMVCIDYNFIQIPIFVGLTAMVSMHTANHAI